MSLLLSILRGINVSGHRKIAMADLKALYAQLGFTKVTTYIQSGNVVFDAGKMTAATAARKIEEAIKKEFQFEVPVLVLNRNELQAIVSGNPFLREDGVDTGKLHITCLSEAPANEKLDLLNNITYPPDRFIADGKSIYLYCPEGYGNTKLTNTFFENKLKVTATTRNWKTIGELLRIME